MSATVRVRILVAVDTEGKWVSAGYNLGCAPDPKDWIMLDDLGLVFRYHYVEAEIPLPEPEQTITGSVSDGGTG